MIAVLWFWNRPPTAPTGPTPTPTLDALSMAGSAVPTATLTRTPSPTPVTYTVRPGDTLNAIALDLGVSVQGLMQANELSDPHALNVGQILLVPVDEIGDLATPQPVEAEGASTPGDEEPPPRVEIRGVSGAGDLDQEVVRLLNSGGVANMAGWTLDDGEGHDYVFPSFTLHTGAVSVHTRAGTDTVIDLYWGLPQAVWTPGKVITLRDASGGAQSTFKIPGN